MKKITIKLEQPKARNKLARAVRDPQGAFRPKAERDRTKYTRKTKHRNQEV
jgi:hypothetical protein